MTIATTMKVPVATSERTETRAMPQTPWPEVQPPPMRVPKPTASPPRIRTGSESLIVIAVLAGWAKP